MPYNEYNDARASDMVFEETHLVHQPIVIAIDTSGSMSDRAEDGVTPKIKIVEDMINSLKDIDLKPDEKGAVDIKIIAFDNDVKVLQDWTPLTLFDGNLRLNAYGTTHLGSAVVEAINSTRARRKAYAQTGIDARRAQVFVYTDGESTENMAQAIDMANKYLNRVEPKPSVKMYGILIPPQDNPTDLKSLGDNVTIMRAKDCINGIPATFKFLKDSIVNLSVSSPGTTVTTEVPDGIAIMPGDNVKIGPDGNKNVDENPWGWID